MVDFMFVAWSAVASVLAMFVGWFWFGPIFGSQYKAGMKKMKASQPSKKAMQEMMFWSFIFTAVAAFFFGHVLGNTFGVLTTYAVSLKWGFWIWLGFYLPMVKIAWIYTPGKPKSLFFIDASYWLVVSLLFGLFFSVVL